VESSACGCPEVGGAGRVVSNREQTSLHDLPPVGKFVHETLPLVVRYLVADASIHPIDPKQLPADAKRVQCVRYRRQERITYRWVPGTSRYK
jgi:hypothetical protein